MPVKCLPKAGLKAGEEYGMGDTEVMDFGQCPPQWDMKREEKTEITQSNLEVCSASAGRGVSSESSLLGTAMEVEAESCLPFQSRGEAGAERTAGGLQDNVPHNQAGWS